MFKLHKAQTISQMNAQNALALVVEISIYTHIKTILGLG